MQWLRIIKHFKNCKLYFGSLVKEDRAYIQTWEALNTIGVGGLEGWNEKLRSFEKSLKFEVEVVEREWA